MIAAPEPLLLIATVFLAVDELRAEARAAKLRAKKHKGRRNKHAAREVAFREALALIAAALPEEKETPAESEIGGRQAGDAIAEEESQQDGAACA